jgi:hypothetical protein
MGEKRRTLKLEPERVPVDADDHFEGFKWKAREAFM